MSRIRRERTAEEIKLILSELLLREVSDPRLQDITVTRVDIDRELQYADVYINALGDDTREDDVMHALGKAGGFLRRELGQRMHVRVVPELRFRWDPTLAYAEEVDRILGELNIPAAEDSPAVSEKPAAESEESDLS
jgi:ribosome-binding factor A